jgi:hypothetical protein
VEEGLVMSEERLSERDRIDISNIEELEHWIRKLGCSESELRAAIARVGPLVESVVMYMAQEPTVRLGNQLSALARQISGQGAPPPSGGISDKEA